MAQFTSSLKALTIGSNTAISIKSIVASRIPEIGETQDLINSVKTGHVMASDNVVWKARNIISSVGARFSQTSRPSILRSTASKTPAEEDSQTNTQAGQSTKPFRQGQFSVDTAVSSSLSLSNTNATSASSKDISAKQGAFTPQTFSLRTGSGYSTVGTRSQDTAADYKLPQGVPAQEKVQPVVNARRDPIENVASTKDRTFPGLRPYVPTVQATVDAGTPANRIYPKTLTDVKLTTGTHPFLTGPLAPKPPLKGKTDFEFIRSSGSYNLTTLKPPALSSRDADTAAAQPLSGPEALLDEVARSRDKRVGTPYAKKNATTENIFTESDTKDPAFRPSSARIGEVKRHKLQGNTFVGWEEFSQTHRFYVTDITKDSGSVFEWEESGSPPTTLAAGFSGCTAPRFELANKEIKEGTWEFPRIVCTGATLQSVTLSKGLVKAETGFYLWILNAMRGLLTRRTIQIASFGRNPRVPGAWSNTQNLRGLTTCIWTLYNCYPLSYRTGQDWDADSGKIQISELELHYEWFEESAGNLYKGTTSVAQ